VLCVPEHAAVVAMQSNRTSSTPAALGGGFWPRRATYWPFCGPVPPAHGPRRCGRTPRWLMRACRSIEALRAKRLDEVVRDADRDASAWRSW